MLKMQKGAEKKGLFTSISLVSREGTEHKANYPMIEMEAGCLDCQEVVELYYIFQIA